MTAPKWTQWWQDDLPCHFQPDRALENSKYLTTVLGKAFVAHASTAKPGGKHPLIDLWSRAGGDAFVLLNALAEDLRVIEGAPGLESLVKDLRRERSCRPAWHAIHSAAFLGRADRCRVTKFFPQTEDLLPDFLVDSEGQTIAVEAKLLTKSSPEQAFVAHFRGFPKSVIKDLTASGKKHVIAVIVVKNADDLPDVAIIRAIVRYLITIFHGGTLKASHPQFNVFLEELPPFENGPPIATFACDVISPQSTNEDLRVLDRGKKASKQLGLSVAIDYPGLLVIGIDKYHDQRVVARRFIETFAKGRMSGVSSVLLMSQGAQLRDPIRAPIDLIAAISNPNTSRPLPNIPWKPVGVVGHLIRDTPEPTGRPSYRVASYQSEPGVDRVIMPDVRPLTAELLG